MRIVFRRCVRHLPAPAVDSFNRGGGNESGLGFLDAVASDKNGNGGDE